MARAGWLAVAAVLIGGLAGAGAPADAPAEATVTDAEGKEVKLSGLKFGPGTQRLAYLADPNGNTDEAKKGPLVLALREPHSTTYTAGVVTYVPLASVESIKYDYDKQVATVAVKGLSEPLAGTLQYKGLNVLQFEGAVDGKPTKFSGGGFAKGSIKAVSFADAKPLPARKGGPAWAVQINQKDAMHPTLKAGEFKFVYRLAGGTEVIADAATTHKSDPLKLDAAATAYTTLAVDANTSTVAVEVQSGDAVRIVVIPPTVEKDGKTATLLGALCEVEAGWKLFPLYAVKGMKRTKKE